MGVWLRAGSAEVLDTFTGERWMAGERCRDCGAALTASRSIEFALGDDCRRKREAGWSLSDPALRAERVEAVDVGEVPPASWRWPGWQDVAGEAEEVERVDDAEQASLFRAFEDQGYGATAPADS